MLLVVMILVVLVIVNCGNVCDVGCNGESDAGCGGLFEYLVLNSNNERNIQTILYCKISITNIGF